MLTNYSHFQLVLVLRSEDVDGSLLESLADVEEPDVSGQADMALDIDDSIFQLHNCTRGSSRPQTLSLGTTAAAASKLCSYSSPHILVCFSAPII